MGNRAIITLDRTGTFPAMNIGLYLHWNGGRDSVEAFLTYMSRTGIAFSGTDALLALATVIRNFFGGGVTSLDLVSSELECEDNGTYIVDRDWTIIKRVNAPNLEQAEYDLHDMLDEINKAQPAHMRLPADYLHGHQVKTENLCIGDEIYLQRSWFDGRPHLVTVIGRGEEGQRVNGTDVTGIPYVDVWGEIPAENINNYIRDEYVIWPNGLAEDSQDLTRASQR